MADNPTFVFDEHHVQSNGPSLAPSDSVESDFHDPNFSLAVSPVIPKKVCLEDPSGTRAEVVSIRSLGSGHVVIQIGQGTPGTPSTPPDAGTKQGGAQVEPKSAPGRKKGSPESSDTVTNAGINTGNNEVTNAASNIGKDVGTSKSTNIGKNTDTGKSTSTFTNTVTKAGTNTDSNKDSSTGTNTAVKKNTNTVTSTGTNTVTSTATNTTVNTDTNTVTTVSKNTRVNNDTNTVTSVGMNTGVNKDTNTVTSAGTNTKNVVAVVSKVTPAYNSAVEREAREGRKKPSVEDGSSSPTVDEDDPPWYVVMGEVYKSGKRTSDLSTGVKSQTTSEGKEESEEEEGDYDEDDEEEEEEEEDYDEEDEEEDELGNMLYTIDDNPPWYLAMGLGFQHYLTMVGSTITIPFILTPELCIQQDDPARGFILSTIFFVSGIVTFIQASFGVRLPIVQGGSFAFFAPTLAILHTGFPACVTLDVNDLTTDQRQEEWQSRMREIQGAIVAAALLEMLIGFSGLIGLVVSLITPLAIAPTVCLVGLALFDVAAKKAASHWGISGLTMLLMILFSQYMRHVKVPVPVYRVGKGFSSVSANIFGLFPVLLSILLSWALCAILTAADAFPEGSAARTDTAGKLIADSPWIRVPYPGQWGWPTVSAAGVLGILAALLASIVESVGDYYACARLSGAPPPPRHAINRGIGVEGFGCLIAGFWGSGNGTTSYSENIGAIGITKVGSRRVIQYGAGIMVVCGILGKFAAVFVTIPEPVVGGIFCVMFAMITAVGLSSLQHVDLNSSRNLFVLGFPIFFGLALPKWIESNPGALQSDRYPGLAQVATVLLKTSMFVGGLLGIILDNTIPGTDRERGLHHRRQAGGDGEDTSGVYDFPVGMAFIRRFSWLRKVPFSPTFRGWHIKKKQ